MGKKAKRARPGSGPSNSNAVPSTLAVAVNPDTPNRRLHACWQWCLSQGASAPKLQLDKGPYGWGVFATVPLDAGEEFASIPAHLVLSHAKAEQSDVGTVIAELNARTTASSPHAHPPRVVSPRTLLYLYMLHCLHTPSSPFHLYLASFPKSTSPLHWDAAKLALLKGTNLHQAVPNKLRLLRHRYDNVLPLLTRLHPALFPAEHFTFEHFLWAHTALTSRGFPARLSRPLQPSEPAATHGVFRQEGERQPNEEVGCMLPLLDMTNHRLRTPVEWATVNGHGGGRVAFRTGAAVSAGAEVLNNYGAKSNEEFLLGYGFCLEDNEFDEYTV